MKVLVVEDDPSIRDRIQRALQGDGLTVLIAEGQQGALAALWLHHPALVVLDLLHPSSSSLYAALRDASDTRLLAITDAQHPPPALVPVHGYAGDRVDRDRSVSSGSTPAETGFGAAAPVADLRPRGRSDVVVHQSSATNPVEREDRAPLAPADAYLSAPFQTRDLLTQVRALLREARKSDHADVLRVGAVRLDRTTREVWVGDAPLRMRAKEFGLLAVLMAHAGETLNRATILRLGWGFEEPGLTRTVDAHIYHLRRKLVGSGITVETLRGVGYTLVLDDREFGIQGLASGVGGRRRRVGPSAQGVTSHARGLPHESA